MSHSASLVSKTALLLVHVTSPFGVHNEDPDSILNPEGSMKLKIKQAAIPQENSQDPPMDHHQYMSRWPEKITTVEERNGLTSGDGAG